MAHADAILLSARERDILCGVFAGFADRIESVAVFGSRALGTARPASDIDLAVYGAIGAADIARVWTLLDQSSLAVTADVVAYHTLGDSSLRRHIDRCGKTLFTRADLQQAARGRVSGTFQA